MQYSVFQSDMTHLEELNHFNYNIFFDLGHCTSDCFILIPSLSIYVEAEVIPVLFVAELVFEEEFSFNSSICPGLT